MQAENRKKTGVALVGCGTVGSSVAEMLTGDKNLLASRTSISPELLYVIDKDFTRAKALGLDPSLFRTDIEEVLHDPEVSIVIELAGGTSFAKEVIEKAVKASKHVVTANKALLALHGNELFTLARTHNVCIGFEASCAGGIPIMRALYDGLIANRIEALFGIVNGTCNYILTRMTHSGKSYAQALSEAQDKGLAEEDPALDVSGLDSAHKLAIMAAIAFSQKIDFDAIPVEGIDTLKLIDIQYGQELGYVMKLLAIAKRQDDGIVLSVKPAFIPREHPLAWIQGPFNAVSVYGHAVGHTMYYGRGAGGNPTASAVIADILSIATGTAGTLFRTLTLWPDLADKTRKLPVKAPRNRFYIRVMAIDKPGVLAKIAAVFGKYRISISSVLQKDPHGSSDRASGVPVIITTYQAPEPEMRRALKEVDRLDVITDKSICLSIIDEYSEYKKTAE